MVTSPAQTTTSSASSTELAECGWRVVTVSQADGSTTTIKRPLTPEEFLHPQFGDRLPNSTFHDDVASHAKDILTRRYANNPTIGVYRDLLIEWDIPGQGDLCPDTFVAFGISNKDQNRSKFIVINEGVRPAFVLEVVSPRYRKEDRSNKVVEYARARVQEYVIVDRRRQRGQFVDEVLGYCLTEGIYQPIVPDSEGRIHCDTVGLLFSLQDGHLAIEDANTGSRLLSSVELEAANESAKQQAAEMAAMLERYRERFGDLPEN
ncbi:MAG TPA: hypothetical protein DEA79_18505 [Cyanobacteria bacterium UBA11153]|nr:hypothetical protein [Cyanobacteria bacterium UBA11153]